MCRSAVVLLCLGIIILIVEKVDSFSEDYYFLRSRYDCDSDDFNFACTEKCQTQYTCLFGRCFCILDGQSTDEVHVNLKHNNVLYTNFKSPFPANQFSRAKKTSSSDNEEDSEEESDYDYDRIYLPEKPALRHHIAHFCENLDTARDCIKTCMKQGKPAFCGKDHKCYCGHKYNAHSTNKGVDPNEMYSAFEDLYAKYFGPTEKNTIEIQESDEDDENDRHRNYDNHDI